MDVWTFLWLMVFLKIPIVALFLIVRWAVRQTPETAPGQDGGIGPRPRPRTRTTRARACRARRAGARTAAPRPPRRRGFAPLTAHARLPRA